MRGVITALDLEKQRGSIRGEDKRVYSFDAASLAQGASIMEFVVGRPVEFEVKKQTDGQPKAVNCRIHEHESTDFLRKHALTLHEEKELYDEFCEHARRFADYLKNHKVTTSMIRKIYARVLNARTVTDVKQLRPLFAYTAGRNEKNFALHEFMSLLDYLAREMKLDNEQQLENIKQFMEAIVAYRKYVGDDD